MIQVSIQRTWWTNIMIMKWMMSSKVLSSSQICTLTIYIYRPCLTSLLHTQPIKTLKSDLHTTFSDIKTTITLRRWWTRIPGEPSRACVLISYHSVDSVVIMQDDLHVISWTPKSFVWHICKRKLGSVQQ